MNREHPKFRVDYGMIPESMFHVGGQLYVACPGVLFTKQMVLEAKRIVSDHNGLPMNERNRISMERQLQSWLDAKIWTREIDWDPFEGWVPA